MCTFIWRCFSPLPLQYPKALYSGLSLNHSFTHSYTNGWLLSCKALPTPLGAISLRVLQHVDRICRDLNCQPFAALSANWVTAQIKQDCFSFGLVLTCCCRNVVVGWKLLPVKICQVFFKNRRTWQASGLRKKHFQLSDQLYCFLFTALWLWFFFSSFTAS